MNSPTGTGCRRADHSGVQVVRKWKVARGPARANRRGKRTGRAWIRSTPRAWNRDRPLSRPRPRARRPARRLCSTLQTEQHPSCARWLVWSVCPAPGAPLPWQMTAPASGSEAAMLAAQHAPMGAKICTIRAIRTMGRKFFSQRIANPSASELNHPESPKSRSGSRNYVAASRSKPGEKRCILKLSGGTLR